MRSVRPRNWVRSICSNCHVCSLESRAPRLRQAHAGRRFVDVQQLPVAAGRIFVARPEVKAEREVLRRVGQRNVLVEAVAGVQVGAVLDPQPQRALTRIRSRRRVDRRQGRTRQAPVQVGRFENRR